MIFKYSFYFVNVELIFVPFLFVNLVLNDGKDVVDNYFIMNLTYICLYICIIDMTQNE